MLKRFLLGFIFLFLISLPVVGLPAVAGAEASSGSVSSSQQSEDSHVEPLEAESSETQETAHGDSNDPHADEGSHGAVTHFGIIFAMLTLVLIAGKLGNIVERFGQPAVIGELFAGVVLSGLGYFGWGFVQQTVDNQIIAFMASLGALLLLFLIGLESKISEMKTVGVNALLVAGIGVVTPFVLGAYILAPFFFPEASDNAHLFLGAAMVATSVGITASVFKALGISRTRAAQTVLGAAVIDDVLGLIVLAVVSAIASGGTVTLASVGLIALKSFGFLAAALLLGSYFARGLSKLMGKIHDGIGMKLALAVGLALTFGYLAELCGLEPIIGAFAAGLFLEEVHFRRFADPEIVKDLKAREFKNEADREAVLGIIRKHSDAHVEDLINSLGLIFIPIFFVYTGMEIDFGSLLQPQLYVVAFAISLFAVLGKLVAGIAAKGQMREKLLVGISMVPRGEVGLIFAATGAALGVLNSEMFSVIVLVVIITTFISPPLIKMVGANNG